MGRGSVVLALVLVILMVWMSGCADVSFGSQQLGDFGNSVEEKAAIDHFIQVYGNPRTNSGPPRFLEPMVTTGLSNNTPLDSVTKFSKDTRSITFWVFYDNFKQGDPLTIRWTFNGKDIFTQEKPAGGDFGRAFIEFLEPDRGWVTGEHMVTIAGGGTSAVSRFEIADGPTISALPAFRPLPADVNLYPLGHEAVGDTCRGIWCNGKCVDTGNDSQNCGGCGVRCDVPQYCNSGVCTPGYVTLDPLPATAQWGDVITLSGVSYTTYKDVVISLAGPGIREVPMGPYDGKYPAHLIILPEEAFQDGYPWKWSWDTLERPGADLIQWQEGEYTVLVSWEIPEMGGEGVVQRSLYFRAPSGPVTCPSGQTKCGDACANLLTDLNNCGACGKVCVESAETCAGGVCIRVTPK